MDNQYPAQAEFNADHKMPHEYGEDGDLYAVSTEYSAEKAGKLFEQVWLEQTGEKVDFHYSIGVANVTKGPHPDEPGEETWIIDRRGGQWKPVAQAIIIHGF